MLASDPEVDHSSGSGWKRSQICGGDHVDVDGGWLGRGEFARSINDLVNILVA